MQLPSLSFVLLGPIFEARYNSLSHTDIRRSQKFPIIRQMSTSSSPLTIKRSHRAACYFVRTEGSLCKNSRYTASELAMTVKRTGQKSTTKAATRARQPQFVVRQGPEGELKLPDGAGSVIYVKEFLSASEADALLQITNGSRSWARTPISFFGKSVLQPRDTAFFGTKLYSYSDERRVPTHWNDDPPTSTALLDLGTRIEEHLALPKGWFNVILANRYHHGQDFMGWHSDNEKSLGDEPIIASISLGAERRFLIRKKGASPDHVREKIEYVLAHGSLLVMLGKMQKLYQHSLPKVALSKCNALRVNFTYRRVIDESDHSKG